MVGWLVLVHFENGKVRLDVLSTAYPVVPSNKPAVHQCLVILDQ